MIWEFLWFCSILHIFALFHFIFYCIDFWFLWVILISTLYLSLAWNVIVAHNPYDAAFESNGHATNGHVTNGHVTNGHAESNNNSGMLFNLLLWLSPQTVCLITLSYPSFSRFLHRIHLNIIGCLIGVYITTTDRIDLLHRTA